jgi:hypothetical protein
VGLACKFDLLTRWAGKLAFTVGTHIVNLTVAVSVDVKLQMNPACEGLFLD